jgi:hypothetical protein
MLNLLIVEEEYLKLQVKMPVEVNLLLILDLVIQEVETLVEEMVVEEVTNLL